MIRKLKLVEDDSKVTCLDQRWMMDLIGLTPLGLSSLAK